MTFPNRCGQTVLWSMVHTIQQNKAYLSELDGKIGDGDHGSNMNKGFSLFAERYLNRELLFTEGLNLLGVLLLNEIGGSMGPIYGTIFMGMAEAEPSCRELGLPELTRMLKAARADLGDILEAQVGDKTIVDTLEPSVASLCDSMARNEPFVDALEKMKLAAALGRDSTRDMLAKFGRASRLGERSRGVVDAGAASCCLLLTAMADGMLRLLREGEPV